MKKVLSGLLVTALLLTNMANAHTCKKRRHGVVGTMVNGTWQVVKIGVGLGLMAGGVIAAIPCASSGVASKVIGKDIKDATNDDCPLGECMSGCGNCCIVCGILVALPVVGSGILSIKSGLHGFKKLIKGKKCKKCKHKQVIVIQQAPQQASTETVVQDWEDEDNPLSD